MAEKFVHVHEDDENTFVIELNDKEIDKLIYKLNELRDGGEEHVHFDFSGEKHLIINHSESTGIKGENLADKDVVMSEEGESVADEYDEESDNENDEGDWINEEDEK